MKEYDRAYFDHWYHGRTTRVTSPTELRRKVALAVAVTEYFLRRRLRTVLDVGCGEGGWRSHLRALRPRVTYMGIDASDYAVERFGKKRNIRKGSFADLPDLSLGVFDLVICADVLHYVPDAHIRRGIGALTDTIDGVAFLEVLTREDEIVGDLQGLIQRPAAWYRSLFRKAGLTPAAPYCWLSPPFRGASAALETFE